MAKLKKACGAIYKLWIGWITSGNPLLVFIAAITLLITGNILVATLFVMGIVIGFGILPILLIAAVLLGVVGPMALGGLGVMQFLYYFGKPKQATQNQHHIQPTGPNP